MTIKFMQRLMKAEKKIHGEIRPLAEERIQRVVRLVDREIAERFSDNIKIYEIQNIVEQTLLDEREYELVKNIFIIGRSVIFHGEKRQI